MTERFNRVDHQKYLESNCWKCDQSPTGSHHWTGTYTHIRCKHCGKENKVEHKSTIQIVNDNRNTWKKGRK